MPGSWKSVNFEKILKNGDYPPETKVSPPIDSNGKVLEEEIDNKGYPTVRPNTSSVNLKISTRHRSEQLNLIF